MARQRFLAVLAESHLNSSFRFAAGIATAAGTSTGKHVLLVTTVDIGGGATDKIEFCKGDDPTTVANHFVIKHGLPHSIVGPLTNHILENLKKANINSDKANADGKGKAGAGNRCVTIIMRSLRAAALYSFDVFTVNIETHILYGSVSTTEEQEVLRKTIVAACRSRNSPPPAHSRARSDLHEKLYQESFELRDRLEEKRRAQEAAFEELVNTSKPPMSWVSQEMMRNRTAGPFDNYGEMLYAESLEALQRKKQKVWQQRCCTLCQSNSMALMPVLAKDSFMHVVDCSDCNARVSMYHKLLGLA